MRIEGAAFTAKKAWDSLEIANMSGVTTSVHWTNQPYHWHINKGEEVFVVLSGTVNMHYKAGDQIGCVVLNAGDIYSVKEGEEHFAEPINEARVLVIEQEGSE